MISTQYGNLLTAELLKKYLSVVGFWSISLENKHNTNFCTVKLLETLLLFLGGGGSLGQTCIPTPHDASQFARKRAKNWKEIMNATQSSWPVQIQTA